MPPARGKEGIVSFKLRLPEELNERVEKAAQSQRRSRNNFIEVALESFLDDLEGERESLKIPRLDNASRDDVDEFKKAFKNVLDQLNDLKAAQKKTDSSSNA